MWSDVRSWDRDVVCVQIVKLSEPNLYFVIMGHKKINWIELNDMCRELDEDLTDAISVVNFIKTKSLKAPVFTLWGDGSLQLFHMKLGGSQEETCCRVFELRDTTHPSYDDMCHTGPCNTIEIIHILICKEVVYSVYPLFYLYNVTHVYTFWSQICLLMNNFWWNSHLSDIFEKMNELNLHLQGRADQVSLKLRCHRTPDQEYWFLWESEWIRNITTWWLTHICINLVLHFIILKR